MDLPNRINTTNNFDLIRLVAATQVVVVHAVEHFNVLQSDSSKALALLHFFPGVPVFFFVSGFLIANSFQKSENLKTYSFNRFVRIYPALWVCFLLSVISVLLLGYMPFASIFSGRFFMWAAAQLSFIQFYNPDFMRSYSTGVLNGSLWTISVELQFYVLMPLLVKLIRFKQAYAAALIASFILAMVLSYGSVLTGMAAKLLGVTFLPWIGMFMLGHLCFDQWPRIQPFFKAKFALWAGVYLIAALAGYIIQSYIGVGISGNQLVLPLQLLLAATVLSAAFSRPELARRLLRHNDVSYGMYIYHMPVINLLLFCNVSIGLLALPLVVAVTFILAVGSWLIVEQPALRRKVNLRFAR